LQDKIFRIYFGKIQTLMSGFAIARPLSFIFKKGDGQMKQFPCLIPDCTVLIVGMGLIGTAYARALSEKGYRVFGITPSREIIDVALADGIIEKGSTSVDADMVAQADIIVFGLYPTVLIEWLEKNGHLISPGTVLTDVTGVKGCVVSTVQEHLLPGIEYISAHPMAGRELVGSGEMDVYRAATPDMFRGANYLVVPTKKNTPRAIRLCEQLGRILGFARVTQLSVEEHDRMIAYLSQLTHAIAVALMCCADGGEDEAEGLARLARLTGDSFRDLTRIAKINDAMWSELFLSNREALLEQMDTFMDRFSALRDALAVGDSDTMRDMMRTSTERRRAFDKNS
jgi:prephenate dehydrogenase